MRKWKSEHDPQTRVFLYFQEHPNKFFNARHIATQVRVRRSTVQKIIEYLEAIGKVEGVHCVTSKFWGRPRTLYRSARGHDIHASLAQLEIFQSAARKAGILRPIEDHAPEQATIE